MRKRHASVLLRAASFGVLFFAASVALMGQGTTSATLVGLVKDSTGAVVPSVNVVATNVGTNIQYATVTNSTGNYTIASLPPGTYRVSAELTGFKRMVYDNVVLQVNQTQRLDMTMEVGSVTTSTTVTAKSPLIDTENATLGSVVNKREIVDLPLNGRNFAQLAQLSPGVVPGNRGFGGDQPLSGFDSPNFYAGGRNTNNSFLVDGIETKGTQFGNIVVVPNLDSISEFKVQTNSYSAEFGAAGNGIVNIATASGTNQFHGAVYEFLRNDKLDARNYFDANRPPFKRNQFGFALGGPIIHNKTFFHADYEGLRQRQASTILTSVPTALERQGIFTEFQNPDGSYIPVIDPATGQPYSGNTIPAADINPVGQQVADLYPLPNLPGTSLNYLSNPVVPRTYHEFSVRIDHELSAKDRLFARYIYERRNVLVPSAVPGFNDDYKDHPQNLAMGWTHIFSPTILNDAHLGYQRAEYIGFQTNETKVGHLGGLAIQGPTPPSAFDAYPLFIVSGKSNIGDTPNHFQRFENTYSLADSLTWVRGSHTFKFGFRIAAHRENAVLRQVWLRGGFIFYPVFSGQFIGDAVPELLTGHPLVAIRSLGSSRADGRATDSAYYFQDDWKVSPRLTLNIGMRYEYYQPWVDNNTAAPKATFTTGMGSKKGAFPDGALVVAGTAKAAEAGFTGRANRALYFAQHNNWAPRFGFAWRPFANDNTVVRGGYGIFYNPVIYDAAYFLNLSPPVFALQQEAGFLDVQNAFPPFDGNYDALNGYLFANDFVNGYVQQWNLTIQRRLSDSMALQIGYVGNKGTHLDGGGRVLNQAAPGTGPLAARRPFPNFGQYEGWDSSASSNYHSLQMKLNKHFSQGLQFIAAYTFSKAIDTGAGAGDTFAGGDVYNYQNSAHPDERGLSLFDVRHRFSIGWIYQLPFGKGKTFVNKGGLANAFLGGWQVNGIASFESGFPLTPRTGAPNSGASAASLLATDRPNRICDGNLSASQRTIAEWFDTSCFPPNTLGEWGNSGRGIVTAPGIKNWDLSLFKNFQIHEQMRLQFRSEFFNAFNNVNFGFPNLLAIDPTFGKISSAGASREIQLALKLLF